MSPIPPVFPFDHPVLALHILCATLALGLGPVALLRRRRDRWHRLAGRVWVLAMALTSLSSFGIQTYRLIGPFSPIHLLSVLVLVSLWRGVAAARAGRMVEHGRIMVQMQVQALILPAAFTLVPGRQMHDMVLAGSGWAGFAVAAVVMAVLAVMIWRRQPPLPRAAEKPLAGGAAGGRGAA
jgi:uncharacterized membrane protein